MRSPAATLMLRFIQPAEILEHHAALLGRETGQLVPGGIADFRSRAGRTGAQRGFVAVFWPAGRGGGGVPPPPPPLAGQCAPAGAAAGGGARPPRAGARA